MGGSSRAAQRREKKKQRTTGASAGTSSTGSAAKSTPQAAKTYGQRKPSVFDSDSEDDDQSASLGNVIPLKSLETGKVRDFVSELEREHGAKAAAAAAQGNGSKKKASKRTRSELEQHEIDKKKKQYREDKAQKIVWRKFDRENLAFEQYYQKLFQLPAEDWQAFMASLQQPMPIHVRVNGNYHNLSEIVTGALELDFDLNSVAVKLASGDDASVAFAPVAWHEDKKLWKLTIDSKSLRKCEPLRDLSNYFKAQGYLGTLLRQEPGTSILPVFLGVQPGDKVLDLCSGGEHRAPMLAELMTPEDADGSNKLAAQSGVLVVNERDATAAASAVRSIARTLALSSEVVVTSHKPLEFPAHHEYSADEDEGAFDRIVCTVPCSGDGLVRKIPEKWRMWSPAHAFKFHASQLALVSKAMSLAKVGATVLYSTRSFNPIENEAVVAELLRSGKAAYELVDISDVLPTLKRSNGLTQWAVLDEDMEQVSSWEVASEAQKKLLRPSMWAPSAKQAKTMHLDRCVRLLPHQNDTHGLFVAVLKKVSKCVVTPAGPTMVRDAAADSKQLKKQFKTTKKTLGSFTVIDSKHLRALQSFYGLPRDTITQAHMMERSGFAKDRSVHLVTPAVSRFIDHEYKHRLNVYKAGVEVLLRRGTGYEITDEGARALLPVLTTRVINLQMSDFSALLESKEMWLKNASEAVAGVLSELGEGSLVVVLDDMEPAQTADQDILLVATKRHNSYSVMSTTAAIARVKALISELNADEGEDDGYDSFEFED